MRVSVNILEQNPNAAKVTRPFAEGITAAGDTVIVRSERDSDMRGFDAAVFWGYVTSCQQIEAACRQKGIPFIYVDFGYWRREKGYYKAALNARHPTAYLMQRAMPADRWESLRMTIQPWRKKNGGPIILAGMSGKGAWSWNWKDSAYETAVVNDLKDLTKRKLIYRPKPNWHQSTPIRGTIFDRLTPIDKLLNGAHCVITHHSNVGSDAIIAGVPVFTKHGAALPMGLLDTELARIEDPAYPDGREQWAANLAYCQWTLQEMASGKCWKHMRTML
jgi:hypothetical protein